MKNINQTIFSFWFVFLTCLHLPSFAIAQEINLDKMEKCGDLLCYQSMDDTNVFHYLPDQPRLAYKDGRPQFSFLKYARVEETGEAGTGRAQGGGIVHFLVTYGADKGRVTAAEADLQEKLPDARIAGPIIYRKGSFALITSFQEENQTTTRTVAVGKAPLMEGQKAAVSMALTREGAELLWESFQTATPDISLVFDMQFAGVREPYEATLEADWARIVKHDQVKAGVKYAWFGADVDMLFQELRQDGAIKITTKGKDATMDKILQSAHAKLLKVIFDPAPVDELTKAAAEKDSYSNLNQAVKLLKDAASSRSSKKKSSWLPDDPPFLLADTETSTTAFNDELVEKYSILNWLVSTANAADESPQWKEAQKLFNEGETAFSEKRYSEALVLYEKSNVLYRAVKGHESPELIFDMGICNYHLKNWDVAISYLQNFLSLIPQNPELEKHKVSAYISISRSLQSLGKNDEARAYLEKAEADPSGKTAEGLNKLADAYYNMGSYARSAFYYKKALGAAQPGSSAERYAKRWAGEVAAKAYSHARKLDETARASKYEVEATQQALNAYTEYQDNVAPTGQREKEVESRVKFLAGKLEQQGAAKTVTPGKENEIAGKTTTAKPGTTTPPSAATKKSGDKAKVSKRSPTSRGKTASKGKKPAKRSKTAEARSDGSPGFSLVASYRMKRIKRTGKFTYHMNHYRTEVQAFAMAENIGDLFARFGRDPKIFRAVTIDDPVFKQREILVTLDGQDTRTFTSHLNFVTVQMQKQHQSGDLTTDEVIITPEKFNTSGNAFVLSYGWKGDDDRTKWLDYRVQALWSFHGGVEIRQPWTEVNSAMLALDPPHRYRMITIEGDGQQLSRHGVRHAVVTVTSNINGKPVTNQLTIRNIGPAPAMVMEVPESREGEQSEVQITWYLQGGKKVNAPMQLMEGDILYWDELPEG